MKKFTSLLFALAIGLSAQVLDNIKYRNFIIPSFKADSTKYTPWFNIADYSYITVQVRFNDTTSAGYASDSVEFSYALELGNPAYNSSGTFDTAVVVMPIVIDSINTLVSANYKTRAVGTKLGVDGTYIDSLYCIDTTSVTGFAVQSHSIRPATASYGRLRFKGGTSNKVGAFVRLSADVIQFKGDKVRSKEPIDD